MKLAVSNIAWSPEEDEQIYEYMGEKRMAIEIAPTRITPWKDDEYTGRKYGPYDQIGEATSWSKHLYAKYGIKVVSMQSILNSIDANFFKSTAEKKFLLSYLKRAIDYARAIGCGNLVFGCPMNRNIPKWLLINDVTRIAVDFFSELTVYAAQNGVCLSIEANPEIYRTNFITQTEQAFDLVKYIQKSVGKRDAHAIKVNLDFGTIICNRERISSIVTEENIPYINHVHISEPNLTMLKKRKAHAEVIRRLEKSDYSGYVSIEMKMPPRPVELIASIEYIRSLA